MNDTPDHIYKIQDAIFNSWSVEERFRRGAEMMDDGRRLVESSIRNANPDISEKELKAQVFKRFYENDFTEKALDDILVFLRK